MHIIKDYDKRPNAREDQQPIIRKHRFEAAKRRTEDVPEEV